MIEVKGNRGDILYEEYEFNALSKFIVFAYSIYFRNYVSINLTNKYSNEEN